MNRQLPLLVLLLAGYLPTTPGLYAQLLAHSQSPADRAETRPVAVRTIRVRDALMLIKKKYGVDILFEEKLLDGLTIPADLVSEASTVEHSLRVVLQPVNLRYQKVQRDAYVILPLRAARKLGQLLPGSAPGDDKSPVETMTASTGAPAVGPVEVVDRVVTGQVQDITGNGLPGVNVLVKATKRGTVTDATGRFQISLPTGEATLLFTFIGYAAQEVAINSQTTLTVTMTADNRTLNEVVVVGYGTVKKSDLTGSVAQVKGETIRELPIASVEQGLQGRAPGIQVVQSSGQPGAGLSVRIRGASSIAGGNEPLYVIDGFPLFNSDTRTLNGLSTINPGDIQSIEILKDASATAIYGSRGANGVVIITTKTAKKNESRVEFNAYYGVQQVRKQINVLDARGYAELANAALVNDGKQPYFDLANLPANTNWQNQIFRQAPIQNYDLSYAGGGEKSRIVVAANYFNQGGIIVNSGFQRGSLRINGDNDLGKRVKLQTRLLLSRSMQTGSVTPDGSAAVSASKGVIGAALQTPPTIPVYDATGNYASAIPYPFSGTETENPLAVALEVLNKRTVTRILGGVNLGVEISPGLVNNLRVGIDYADSRRDYYVSRRLKNLGSGRGDGIQTLAQGNTYLLENTLTYNRALGKNSLEALAGYGYQKGLVNSLSGSSSGYLSDDLQNAALQAGSTFGIPSTNARDSTLISWFGRVRFNLRDKYLFTVSGRSDGASVFSQNHKYGFFPSAAFAWRVSEESFLTNNARVSNLKFRASWGQSGNPAIPSYQSLSVSNPIQTSLGETLNLGLAPARLANPNLKWETTTQFNLGLDLGLWQERLQFTADYYVKSTKDLLATVTLPTSSGFATIIDNVGASRNTGIELGLSYAILSGPNWKWTVDGNFAANKNRVTQTKDGKDIYGPGIRAGDVTSHIIRPGEPLAAFYGTVFTGLGEDGLYRYKDQNNDGIINASDRVVIGKAFPDFFYGFNSRLSYRGFDLSLFLQGVSGVNIINQTTPRGVSPIDNTTADAINYYPKPGATYSKPSIAGFVRPTVNPGFSSFNVEDGSYLRLRNIKLAYNLPVAALKLNALRAIQVYISGQNLLTFTKYTGYDPEVNSFGGGDLRLGVDFGAYPAAKTYTAGIKIEF